MKLSAGMWMWNWAGYVGIWFGLLCVCVCIALFFIITFKWIDSERKKVSKQGKLQKRRMKGHTFTDNSRQSKEKRTEFAWNACDTSVRTGCWFADVAAPTTAATLVNSQASVANKRKKEEKERPSFFLFFFLLFSVRFGLPLPFLLVKHVF